MSKGTPIIGIRLDPDIRRSLEDLCRANGITISDAVRLALLDFLDKNKKDA